MKSMDLLTLVGHTNDCYLRDETSAKKHRAHPLLVAAIVALTAILVGCTAVYLIHARDIRLGQQTITQQITAPNSIIPVGTEEVHRDIFSLAGWEGTPEYQASQEWFAFDEGYDYDHTVLAKFHLALEEDREKALSQIPKDCQVYGVYSCEMADKIHEIAEKYDLKLRLPSERISYYPEMTQWHSARELTGTDFFLPNSETTIVTDYRPYVIWASPDGSAGLSCQLKLPDAVIQPEFGFSVAYSPLGYFDTNWFSMTQEDNWTELNYETKTGDQVLILHAGEGLYSWILCYREDGIISISVETRLETFTDEGGVPRVDSEILSVEQLQAIADTIDFQLLPKPNMELCRQEALRSEAEWDRLMRQAHPEDYPEE